MGKTEMARVNMNMPAEMKAWCVKRGEELGISYSAFIITSLNEVRKQENAIMDMAKLADDLNQIKATLGK